MRESLESRATGALAADRSRTGSATTGRRPSASRSSSRRSPHVVGRPDLVESVPTAARLSKVDLTTLMVKEFTDLQGVVGGIYARREGQPDAVWKAIYDQYRPASATRRSAARGRGRDPFARRPVRHARGLFSIGLVPTGSKDPYGLRRAAFGIVVDRRREAAGGSTGGRSSARRSRSIRADCRAAGADEALVGARDLLRRAAAQPARAARPLVRRDLGRPDRRRLGLRGRGGPRAALSQARREMDFRSLILAFKRIRNIVGEEAARAPSSTGALPRGRRAPARGRLPAGAVGRSRSWRPRGATARPWR